MSPNQSTGLSFHRATTNLRSREEIELIKSARALLCRLKASARITPTIGSWTDGVENSVLIRGPLDLDRVRYLSAMLGRRFHQKSALYFMAKPDGPDTMHTIRLGRRRINPEKTAEILEKAGIHFRTIVPLRNSTIVYVVEPKGEIKGRAENAARRLGARISSTNGTSEFIGNDTSADAAEQVYGQLIKRYESTHTIPEGGGASCGRRLR